MNKELDLAKTDPLWKTAQRVWKVQLLQGSFNKKEGKNKLGTKLNTGQRKSLFGIDTAVCLYWHKTYSDKTKPEDDTSEVSLEGSCSSSGRTEQANADSALRTWTDWSVLEFNTTALHNSQLCYHAWGLR